MKSISMCLCVCAILCHSGCTPEKETKEEGGRYVVTSALRADTILTREYVSQIRSVRNIEIRAQERGYLQNIYVDEGESVKAGQLLFRIMPKLYEAELLKAEA
ncbi:MAG TPA: biotin/lipoyl-binding protein, partial [Chryseosolibacter sp.]|nr:biotin/lipoyl-binding protein [Chryseosolibacter sp.]